MNNIGRMNKTEYAWYTDIMDRCKTIELTDFEQKFLYAFTDRFERFGVHTKVSTKQHEMFMSLERKLDSRR